MKIIDQSHEILSLPNNTLETIEQAGRTCYKSQDKITPDSAIKFVTTLRDKGHHAMIEFGDMTVKFITNRGVTHEIVRHRMCSFAQESTRYVKYDGEMEFIRPVWADERWTGMTYKKLAKFHDVKEPDLLWADACLKAEMSYKTLLDESWRPEQAREVLPNSLKTEIIVKANIREWRHIFSLRCSKNAHPQMRALMIPLLKECKERLPIIFDQIIY